MIDLTHMGVDPPAESKPCASATALHRDLHPFASVYIVHLGCQRPNYLIQRWHKPRHMYRRMDTPSSSATPKVVLHVLMWCRLVDSLERPEEAGKVIPVGGPDVLTYRQIAVLAGRGGGRDTAQVRERRAAALSALPSMIPTCFDALRQ